eukprot:scaffold59867_cov56-Phaeocystis_antarctica.AAC.3
MATRAWSLRALAAPLGVPDAELLTDRAVSPTLLYSLRADSMSTPRAYVTKCPAYTPTGAARLPLSVAALSRTHSHVPPQLREGTVSNTLALTLYNPTQLRGSTVSKTLALPLTMFLLN